MKARQIDLISRALVGGEAVSPVTASANGIWRLSSIIHRLRRRGWPIESHRHQGNGMATYRLPAGWRPNSSPN